jgi:Dna[CI] antecedent, DciA
MLQRPRSLAELLQTGDIGRLQDQAAKRRRLTETLRTVLAPDEALHLVAAWEDGEGRIVLAMDSPAWAAKLRYERPTLDGRAVRVKVLPRSSG